MRNQLCFSHCLLLWPLQGCSGSIPSSIHPGAHLSSCGTVSLNSACTLSLLSLEIHVLAHPLEQLQPSMNGGNLQCCRAQGLVAADVTLQVPLQLALHQLFHCPFSGSPYSWICISCSIPPFAGSLIVGFAPIVPFPLLLSIGAHLLLGDADW